MTVRYRYPLLLFTSLGLAIAFAACGITTSATSLASPTPTLPPPSAIPAGACARVAPTPTPTSAVPSNGLSHLPSWPGVAFPSNTTLVSYQNGADDGTQHSDTYEVVAVCSDGITPVAVKSFYDSGMPAQGWTQSQTFPYQGDITAACGDPYCWKKAANANTTIFVALENVRAGSTATLFTMRYLTYNVNT